MFHLVDVEEDMIYFLKLNHSFLLFSCRSKHVCILPPQVKQVTSQWSQQTGSALPSQEVPERSKTTQLTGTTWWPGGKNWTRTDSTWQETSSTSDWHGKFSLVWQVTDPCFSVTVIFLLLLTFFFPRKSWSLHYPQCSSSDSCVWDCGGLCVAVCQLTSFWLHTVPLRHWRLLLKHAVVLSNTWKCLETPGYTHWGGTVHL